MVEVFRFVFTRKKTQCEEKERKPQFFFPYEIACRFAAGSTTSAVPTAFPAVAAAEDLLWLLLCFWWWWCDDDEGRHGANAPQTEGACAGAAAAASGVGGGGGDVEW